MSYVYKKLHTKVNYSPGTYEKSWIVIHYTGNSTDTAVANAKYFENTNRGASAHLFVDDNYVYEVVAPKGVAWAVGKNYGNGKYFGKCTNKNSISIEMCSTKSKISGKTYANTVELTKKLMAEYKIPVSRVVRHYDVCAKQCPGWTGWIGKNQSIWKKFKKDIVAKKAAAASKTTETTAKCRLYKAANILKGDFGVLEAGTKITYISDTKKGWSKVKYKGHTGYVKNTCIKKKASSYPIKKVSVDSAPLREKNNKNSKKLANIKKGTQVLVISKGLHWSNVKVNGKDGFIYNKKLK